MQKDLSCYLNLQYTTLLKIYTEYECSEFDLYRGKDCQVSVWSEAEILDLPGCKAEGSTPKEALNKLRKVKEEWLQKHLKRGIRIPRPTTKANLVIAYFVNGECVNVRIGGANEKRRIGNE